MAQMVTEGRWNELLRQIPIHKGDFFQIDPGCLHAIKGGTLILETQQSSDITYRFYDYDRLQDGKPRKLHIQQSLDVTTAPFVPCSSNPQTVVHEDALLTHLVTCQYYSVYRCELHGSTSFDWNKPFVNVSILNGCGTIDGQSVKKGDHLLITSDYGKIVFTGEMEFIFSHI